MKCEHTNKEIRFKLDSLSRKLFCYQCLDCGKKVNKGWLPRPEHARSYSPFNEEAAKKRIAAEEYERKKLWYNEKRRQHRQYEDYINNSPKWRRIRLRVLDRCNRLCECCLIEPASQVHHLNYNFLYDEVAWDLKGVCRKCHLKIHGRLFNG